jgi:hypothetical protein
MNLDSIVLDITLWSILIRFFVNLLVLVILVGFVYYRFSKKEEYLFSYILIGVMIFLICAILGSIDLQMGLALGLFAIFAIIRFRTIQYSVKDITYVFIVIGISVINSQANIPPPIIGAVIINLSIIGLTYLLELFLQKKSLNKLDIIYNQTELLKPGREKELLKDLSRQTGFSVEKVKIQKINICKGYAEVEICYKEKISVPEKFSAS